MTAPIVFIIGCGDYIGAAIARRFAYGGFTVRMARRNGDRLAPLSAEIPDGCPPPGGLWLYAGCPQ